MRRAAIGAAGVWLAAALVGCGGGSLEGGAGAPGAIGGRGGPGTGAGASSGGDTGSGASSGFTGGGAVTGGGAFSGTSGSIAGDRGTGGTGSIGGAGATGGIAGGGEPCPFLQTPVCGREACGNGRRDTCLSPFGPGCALGQVTEACDLGDGPPSLTCAELGYASGATGCAADCSGIDMAACHECFPLQPPVVGCGTVPLDPLTSPQPGLAATDVEVGLAWVETTRDGTQSLGFAQLAPNLDPIRSRVVEQFPVPVPYGAPVAGAAIAPLPTGWVVAVAANPELYLHVLDAQGQVVARTSVATAASSYPSYYIPALVPRPGGGPLIFWDHGDGARAAVIAADGRSVSASFDFPDNVQFVYGAWVQGAFTVVFLEYAVSTSAKALRVDGAGRVTSTKELIVGDLLSLAGAAAGADDLRVFFRDPMPTAPYANPLFFQRFTAAGEPLTERKISHADVTIDVGVMAVARGADTIVLFGEAGLLRHGRVTADGVLQPAAPAIAQAPYGIYPSAVVSRGSDIVVAWTAFNPGWTTNYPGSAGSHVGMARLTP